MNNVVSLKVKPILLRCCPGCGHVVPMQALELLVCNVPCPGCGERRTDEFIPYEDDALEALLA